MDTIKRKLLRFWAACIGAAAYTHSTQGGIARKPVASALFVLGLVAALGPGMAGRVEATGVTHADLKNQLNIVRSQLNHIPPAWSQTLPAAKRFVLVLGGAAVLDKETGLVWEKSPDNTAQNWSNAQFFCNGRGVGGRLGWRLPTIQELASLVDPGNPGGNPDLPLGHPFTNVQSSNYWSATTDADDTGNAWVVNLDGGGVLPGDKGFALFVWCVRGGQGVDPQ